MNDLLEYDAIINNKYNEGVNKIESFYNIEAAYTL